jgi:hypothetical protein
VQRLYVVHLSGHSVSEARGFTALSLKWPNRVAWVRNALCDKGAIDRTVQGTWVITETGRQMVETQGRLPLYMHRMILYLF